VTDLSELRFFQTSEHDCGYLPERQARNVFVDPNQEIDASAYNFLSAYGFRRSGSQVYKPHCVNCTACIPFRVITQEFVPNRSQRRCLRKNEDLSISLQSEIDTDEMYDLYERYIRARHSDGEMFPPSREQFTSFLSREWGITRYLCFREPNGKLISVAVTDVLPNGFSAMYSFFDPSSPERSLGVFNVLYQIQWARESELEFLYLGYWIQGCQKMEYKRNFAPNQMLIDNQWVSGA